MTENLDRAICHLDAREIATGEYAHYDSAMGRWYSVSADELETLCKYLDDPALSGDAYSHWCSATCSTEMPEGWVP